MKKILLILFSLSLIVSACAPKKMTDLNNSKLKFITLFFPSKWNSKTIIAYASSDNKIYQLVAEGDYMYMGKTWSKPKFYKSDFDFAKLVNALGKVKGQPIKCLMPEELAFHIDFYDEKNQLFKAMLYNEKNEDLRLLEKMFLSKAKPKNELTYNQFKSCLANIPHQASKLFYLDLLEKNSSNSIDIMDLNDSAR